jgi:hypothetical protein
MVYYVLMFCLGLKQLRKDWKNEVSHKGVLLSQFSGSAEQESRKKYELN